MDEQIQKTHRPSLPDVTGRSKDVAQPADQGDRIPAAPKIELPKGGGAIRSIGEKYVANAATGSGTCSIPVYTSPSRGGFSPQLVLAYDSGMGNGVFGAGWSLGLAAITRKTDKGLPRYFDADESDVFILSAAEDLVPSQWPNDGDFVQGARDAGTHRVQCYRPRVEGLFSRIEKWTRKTDGDIHWRAHGTDNVTYVYGFRVQARIADPEDFARVFSWQLEWSFDDRGNVIAYRYRPEDGSQIPPTLWEQGRRYTNTYPDRILYGNREPFDPTSLPSSDPRDYLYELVFDYGERAGVPDTATPPYAPPAPWTVRADRHSSYKATFEIRTARLCQRAMMFHRHDELSPNPYLVRTTELTYDGDPALAHLSSATQVAFIAGQAPVRYPPLELGYSRAQVDPTVRVVGPEDVANLPAGANGKDYLWVDLDGEGLPGVLTEQAGAWFYKRNEGEATFSPIEMVATLPGTSRLSGGQRLLDLAGDGTRYLVRLEPGLAGFYDRTADASWETFLPFRSFPNHAFEDPNLRFIDLDGDGLSDVLVTEDEVLRWYPSRGREGFGPAQTTRKAHDEARGPTAVFADADQSFYLADMSGSGLEDLVRIRPGSVSYWPNLGYGRFGARVQMGGAPVFDGIDQFEPQRIRLADIDGSGTTDILYLHRDGVHYWLNRAGNSFGPEIHLPVFPAVDGTTAVDVLDLLGNGTACVVWSSPLASDARQPLRYVELTGGIKPHLLVSLDNHLGKTISVEYAASTKFYLQDRREGRPWITRVPFPVQVVERLITTDQISGTVLVNRFVYHEGFYDGWEREFRGFGMAEQFDTETFANLIGQGLFPSDPAHPGDPAIDLYVPPTLIKTWFHTGAFLEGEKISRQFENQYWRDDPADPQLADSELPAGLSASEARQALRAMRGKPLRKEIFALDAGTHPFLVVETNYRVERLQATGANRHGVFLCVPRETLTRTYERDPTDPRAHHQIVLTTSPYGVPTSDVDIAYRRRSASSGTLICYREHDLAHRASERDGYRINVHTEERKFELTGLPSPSAAPYLFQPSAFSGVAALAATAIPFEQTPSGGPQLRWLHREQAEYYGDNATTAVPIGQFGIQALMRQQRRMVMTDGLVAQVFPSDVTNTVLTTEGGYSHYDGGYWLGSAIVEYSAAQFYSPHRFIDAWAGLTRIEYDTYAQFPHRVRNALDQIVEAQYDYRVLSPNRVTDPNTNSSFVTYDARGLVYEVTVTGANGEGDTLAAPSSHFETVIEDFAVSGAPSLVYARVREQHNGSAFQEMYLYCDGSGRELMRKQKSDPGPAFQVDGAGNVITVQTPDRWLATGRTVYDNKGNAIKRYEPYYAVGSAYETEVALTHFGVTSIAHYDAVGRLVRTDFPDGSYAKTEISAWQQLEWDRNDTLADSLWPARPGQTPADQRATGAARLHRKTPDRLSFDARGRVVAVFADNTTQNIATEVPPNAHVLLETRYELDIDGNLLAITDPRAIVAAVHRFDMAGSKIETRSVDAGTSWAVLCADSQPLRSGDARGFVLAPAYDVLRRPTGLTVKPPTGPAFVAERMVYGDDPAVAPVDPTAYLVGRLYRQYDGAGILTYDRYDFKGNSVAQTRQLITTRAGAPDWSSLYLTPLSSRTEYDALNRPTRLVMPRLHGGGNQNTVEPGYDKNSRIARIRVQPQHGPLVDYVGHIEYDANNRRTRIEYGGSGLTTRIRTECRYDPLTFRLIQLVTRRPNVGDVVQDLTYTYDAVGNVTEVADVAQPIVFSNNQAVEAASRYTYDSIYRLTDASGREFKNPTQPGPVDLPLGTNPEDANNLVRYFEHYEFDAGGNVLEMRHSAGNGTQTWSRRYQYEAASNRLTATSLPGDPAGVFSAAYVHDAAGNMTSMPHLANIEWDHRGRMVSADLGGGGTAYFIYDAAGMRTRKVVVSTSGKVRHERLYWGAWEAYRELDNAGAATLERESVHVMDGTRRAAIIETQTVGQVGAPSPTARYQLDNLLSSACLELDDTARFISYEEYYPFGATSYHSNRGDAEVSLKRYRYLGRERDEETGLYFNETRYYAAWLGRWTCPDLAGAIDSINLYQVAKNNPLRFVDPNGTDPTDATTLGDKPPQGLKPKKWNPPGKQHPAEYVGNEIHKEIAAYYQAAHPGNVIYTNYSSISEMANALGLGNKSVKGEEQEPDIADFGPVGSKRKVKIYEIRPENDAEGALAKAVDEVSILNKKGIPARLGPMSEVGTSGWVPAPNGWAKFWSPAPGVIVYKYVRDEPPGKKKKAQEKAAEKPKQEPKLTDDSKRPPIIIDWQDIDIGTGQGTKTGTPDEINLPKGEPANDNAKPAEGEGVKEAARTAVKTGATIGAGYVAYRVIRFIPSLFPPLWWTIPENAVIP